MKLSEELQWRGLVGQTTFTDLSEIDKSKKTFYLGVDPSADSMTIGNLAALTLALRFAQAGHEPILLVGGATGMAGGDPDGKDETRAKIPLKTLKKNIAALSAQFQKIFRGQKISIVNNYDWFQKINYIDFLRDVGWHFSMTQLLDREFIQNRIGAGGKGLNYAEFSYSLIQGYDFYHLFREKNATLQLCAVDQFGNASSGMSMIRKFTGEKVDVFAMPLVINKSTGKKFGKSESGAIWLSPEKTSPFQFYQFWLNVDDLGVIDYLKIYTFLSKEKINAIAENHFANPGQRAAQKTLAHEVTALVHGEKIAEIAEKVTRVLFGGAKISELSSEDLNVLAQEIPVAKIGASISEILVSTKIAKSRSEALRLISQNAISINGEKIADDQKIREISLIKKGKNQFALAQ